MGVTRRILVTGSASGIGAALVTMLREADDEVIGLDRAGGDIVCDLCDPDAIADVAARLDGPLAGLAHVAGLPGTASVDAIFAVNVNAPRILTQALADKLDDRAAIVAVSSVTAARCTLTDGEKDALLDAPLDDLMRKSGIEDGKAAYEHSKALLNRWVQGAASDFRPRSIRVNTVSPGPVETPILRDFEESIGADRIAGAARLTGRHADPREIASAIAFLLSRDAAWINGTDLKVDGGYHAFRSVMEPA